MRGYFHGSQPAPAARAKGSYLKDKFHRLKARRGALRAALAIAHKILGGVEALKACVAPGPEPLKAQAALRVAEPLLSAPVADRPNWTLGRLAEEIASREGVTISRSQLSKVLGKKRKGVRTKTPSTASACGSTCARRRPRPAISSFCSPTRAKLSPIPISPAPRPGAARSCTWGARTG